MDLRVYSIQTCSISFGRYNANIMHFLLDELKQKNVYLFILDDEVCVQDWLFLLIGSLFSHSAVTYLV